MTEEIEAEVIEADAPEDIGEDLAEMLAGIAGEAESMDIWRRAERPPRKYEFLDNWALEDFSLSVVAGRFGGGDYRLQVKRAAGTYIKGTSRTFRVGGPPLDPARGEPQPEGGPAASNQFSVLADLMRDMAAELRARHAEPQAGGDPMAMAMELSKAMREAAAESAAQVRDMMGGDRGGAPDPLDLVERLMDLQDRFGGGGGGGTDSMVNALGRELLTVFKNARESGSGQESGAAGVAPTAGQAGPVSPDSLPAANPDQPAWVGMLAPWLPNLIELAARGRDPYTYANVIQDQLDDRALDLLASVVAGTGFAEAFYLHFPDTLQHRAWFDELLGALREDLTEGEAHAIDPDVPASPEGTSESAADGAAAVSDDGS